MNLFEVDLHALEPAQRSVARKHRLPRRELSSGMSALLLVLRIYVIIAVPLVVFAFIRALG